MTKNNSSYVLRKMFLNGRQRFFSGISSNQTTLSEQVSGAAFFVDIKPEFLRNNCQNEEDGDKEMDELRVLWLDNLHIRSLGIIGNWCPNLVVCILAKNHLKSIIALHGCFHLIKLDIHGNQLVSIPDKEFWSKMHHLEFLYLHDNPIASVDTVTRLAVCPKLTALTMYDTPLSLLDKYRHFVVNMLSVLKALDHYVVADQEIIEDLKTTERFAAFRLPLKIHLCSSLNQKRSSSTALEQVAGIRCNINYIMAHHSPVLIIQKWIRSYLTRLRLKQQPKTGLMVTTSCETRSKTDLQLYNFPITRIAATMPTTIARFQSERTETSTNSPYSAFAPPESLTSQEFKISRSPKININQLKAASFLLMNDIIQQKNGAGDGINAQKPHLETNPVPKKKTSQRNQKRAQSSKSGLKTEEMLPLTFTGDEIPISNFCLQGFKKEVLSTDAFSELMLNHHNTGAAIRDVHVESHASPNSGNDIPISRKFRAKQGWPVNKQFQKRILNQVNMSCLFAIQQAYQDQQRINYQQKRTEATQQQHTERCLAQRRRQILQEKKRNMMVQEKEAQKQRIHEGISQNAAKKTKYLEKQRELRSRAQLAHSRMEEDILFMQEFDQRQFSITRALSKNDRQQLEEKATLRKRTSVKELKQHLQSSHERIRNFQMQKIAVRQAKSIEQNTKIRESVSQIALQKLKEAQVRVSQQKGGKKQSDLCNLPRIIVNEHGKGKGEEIEQQREVLKKEEKII